MLGSMFHSMLLLNLNEFNPFFTVFVLGSWMRSFILRLSSAGLLSKISHRKEGFLRLGICRPLKAKFVDFYLIIPLPQSVSMR